VKQEIDRNEDMLRSCLRAVDSLAKLPNAAQVPPFKQFMDSVVLGPALKVGGCSVVLAWCCMGKERLKTLACGASSCKASVAALQAMPVCQP
jgi:hypothetical protein